ncbi:MAG TPA: hypothetical protein PLM29_10370 [Deltaproteobacteria bacterium]|nr:hypothetical protein [Deltaproteobacteria bacterium]
MAYIEGFPVQDSYRSIVRHLAFMAIVMIAIIGFTHDSSGTWSEQTASIAVPLVIILSIMLFVSYKVNPKGWKLLLNKQEYLKNLRQDGEIAEQLLKLDDTHYIIHNITFELFHIEFLVIAPTGVFLIDKAKGSGPLEIRDAILFQNGRTMETLTGNLWRLCHLVNIILKKGYKVDIMPQPVLVIPDTDHLDIKTHDGIRIVTPSELTGLIGGIRKEVLTPEISQGFAFYIKERYGPKK